MPFDWQAELAPAAAPAPASRLKLPRLIAPHVCPPSAPSYAMVLNSTRPKRPMIHCHNPPSKVKSSVFEFHNWFMKKELITVRKISAGESYWTRETSRIPPPKFTSGYGNIGTCLLRGLCFLWVGVTTSFILLQKSTCAPFGQRELLFWNLVYCACKKKKMILNISFVKQQKCQIYQCNFFHLFFLNIYFLIY